jgi:predicted CxxxxCH...CXXCH cytochrome family protein
MKMFQLNTNLIILIISAALILGISKADALDYPHFDGNSIGCDSCHFVYGGQPDLLPPWTAHIPTDIDDTQSNTLCWSCHNDIEAPYVRTHSSLQIDNGYGDWTVECKTCHNPHYQRQADAYGSASYLYSGISTNVTATTLTETGAGWTVNKYQGFVVIPDTAQMQYKYKIVSNTSETLTIAGPINVSTINAGDPFAIVYGKLINSDIDSPNSGRKAVAFFNSSGPNSFADGDGTYDGICEVCHTQTSYHRNDVTGNHTHNVGVDCVTCHIHSEGFKGSGCTGCHGLPPVDGSTLVFNPPVGTGSTTAGAHEMHVITKGFDCSSCHFNSAGAGGSHNNSLTITLGYSLFGGTYQGGAYDGQLGVNYNTTVTSPLTTVTNTGSKTCSNIYCHSTGQSPSDGNSSVPVYANPIWDNPSSAACGTCHDVTEASGLTSGSHAEHLGTIGVNGCGDCHTGAADDASSYDSTDHVNASINVANTYSAGGAPGNGYGTCSAASCHDDGTGIPAVTPVWGSGAPPCTACHGEVPNTGSHQKHVVSTSYNKAECGDCHDSAVQGATAPDQHLDGNIDVYDSSSGDLGYPENKTKGTGYSNCTAAYCHSTGQSTSDGNSSIPAYSAPTWGSPASVACGSCHKVSEVSGLNSGSHAEHLGTMGVNGCGDCHTGAQNDASAYNSILHVDGFVDVDNTYSADGAPGNGYGTCSTASCHDDGTGTMVSSPTWGSSPAACTACHEAAPASGSHSAHLAVSGIACNDCHDSAVESTTAPEQHLDDNIDVYDSASGDLGYPENKAKGSAYTSCSTASCHGGQTPVWGTDFTGIDACTKCHGTATAAPAPDYAKAPPADLAGDSASTDAQVGAHQAHLQSSIGKTVACSECHTVPSDVSDAGHFNDGTPGVAELNFGSLASNNSASPAYTGGQCSSTYCHGNAMPFGSTNGNAKTPAWNDDTYLTGTPSLAGDCSQCHGAPPNASPHGGSETLIQCAGCHDHFNTDGTLNNALLHIDGLVQASGACNSCHGYPPALGDGRPYQDAPTSEGKGAHATHITNIASEKGVTLDPANDTFGAGAAAAVCGVCHTNNIANHMAGTRIINFGDSSAAYQFGPGVPVYNGLPGISSGTTPKTCSNISCHFNDSPTWQDPATAGN